MPPPKRIVASTTAFTISREPVAAGFKLGLYGPEGIGKSSLAALCPGIAFVDAEYSTGGMDVSRVHGVAVEDYAASWANLRRWVQSLNSGVWCIDSITRAEDWAAAFVIANKKTNEGAKASDSLEDFKYKAGLTFVVDEFRRLLGDIDNASRRGASFVLIAHNRAGKFKNPDGSDFIRYEPRLVDDLKASNMLQFVQFLDHLLFIDLDKNVDKGKVKGSGSRMIYLDTTPNRISKTRTLPRDPLPFDEGITDLWRMLGIE